MVLIYCLFLLDNYNSERAKPFSSVTKALYVIFYWDFVLKLRLTYPVTATSLAILTNALSADKSFLKTSSEQKYCYWNVISHINNNRPHLIPDISFKRVDATEHPS